MKRAVGLLIALNACCLWGCSNKKETVANPVVVRISEVIGKSRKEVKDLLGSEDKTEKVSPSRTPCKPTPCDKVFYQNEKYAIVFMNRKADWITVNNLSDIPFEQASVDLLGLPVAEPSFSNNNVKRWEEFNGIHEIMIFNNGTGQVNYVYVKAVTD